MELIDVTKYCHGLQCPKMLWRETHLSGGAKDYTDTERNDEVYRLALKFFKNPPELDADLTVEEQLKRTKELIISGEPVIAGGLFMHKGLICRADILRKSGEGYELIEIKSGSHIHPIVYDELAFKHYVLERCGVKAKRFGILRIDRSYERRTKLNVNRLFVIRDCTEDVKTRQKSVVGRLSNVIMAMRQEQEPQRKTGPYCTRPVQCRYKDFCHRDIPYPSVFDIHKLSIENKYRLAAKGIITYEDIIKRKIKLSDESMRQVNFTYYNLPPEADKPRLREFLGRLSYPLYFLDFECFQQTIPLYKGVKPFMPIPFQFSLHVQEKRGGEVRHFEFLAQEGTDPRRPVAEKLCEYIPGNVCLLAFNMSLERAVLRNLAEQFPDLSERLMGMHDSLNDLMEPFESGMYYAKEMEGSCSIKSILPALCGEDEALSYKSLSGVHDGGEAMYAYANLQNRPKEEIKRIREELLSYCRLDTLAMVHILDKLYSACQD